MATSGAAAAGTSGGAAAGTSGLAAGGGTSTSGGAAVRRLSPGGHARLALRLFALVLPLVTFKYYSVKTEDTMW